MTKSQKNGYDKFRNLIEGQVNTFIIKKGNIVTIPEIVRGERYFKLVDYLIYAKRLIVWRFENNRWFLQFRISNESE